MTVRYNPNAHRVSFYDQADKNAELARLDYLLRHAIQRRNPRWVLQIKARRRKVSGWVVGA